MAPEVFVLTPEGSVVERVGLGAEGKGGISAIARAVEARRRAPLEQYNLPKGSTLGVDGYDVVAYFTDLKAVRGREEFASVYRGVTYRFASEQHRRMFAATPDAYVPTYGGWCASAMGAKGTKVSINPEYFKVKDGRLFLFYKDLFSNALTDWNAHEREWEPAADANWQKTSGERAAKAPK